MGQQLPAATVSTVPARGAARSPERRRSDCSSTLLDPVRGSASTTSKEVGNHGCRLLLSGGYLQLEGSLGLVQDNERHDPKSP